MVFIPHKDVILLCRVIGFRLARREQEPNCRARVTISRQSKEISMRYGLLWLLGVPIPILILIWALGGLN
jgi:hypothetical protein